MRFGLLILLIALAIILFLTMGKSRQDNPVAVAHSSLDKAKGASLEPTLRQVADALDAYADANGNYPDDLEGLVPNYLTRSDFLIDPWGNRLRLEKDVQGNFILVSAGPDRIFSTGDDSRRSL
jgi:hypothetical protein